MEGHRKSRLDEASYFKQRVFDKRKIYCTTLFRDIKATFPYVNIFFKRRKARERKEAAIRELIVDFPVKLSSMAKDNNYIGIYYYQNIFIAQLNAIRASLLPDRYNRKAIFCNVNIIKKQNVD